MKKAHLPFYFSPDTCCWLCGFQHVRKTAVETHFREVHPKIDISTNWGPHRYEEYFIRMESFLLWLGSHLGLSTLREIYTHCRWTAFGDVYVPEALPEDLWRAFCVRHKQPVPEEFAVDPPNSGAFLLHWRVAAYMLLRVPASVRREANKYFTTAPCSEDPMVGVEEGGAVGGAPSTEVQGSDRPPVPMEEEPKVPVHGEQSPARSQAPSDEGTAQEAQLP